MKILVTGGAGYIGSHILVALQQQGYEVVVVDALLRGQSKKVFYGKLEVFDLAETEKLEALIQKENFEAIIHLAAFIDVEESMKFPAKYLSNNTANTIKLLELAAKYNINKFIFSSTAAVYGYKESEHNVVDEAADINPISPYGLSKYLAEKAIQIIGATNANFKFIILRYFNVGGFDTKNLTGYYNVALSSLLAKASRVAVGKEAHLTIYGSDYTTKDGTCERDFIHVSDLADIHLSAINYLDDTRDSGVYNCGYNQSTSIKEVVDIFAQINCNITCKEGARRSGDPVSLIANANKLKRDFAWTPRYTIKNIIESMVEWEKSKL